MKKYLLFFTITLGGCSLLSDMGILAKEYSIPDIAGKAVPASLAGKTLLGSRSAVRFADGYVAFKGDPAFAARILELGATTDPYKMFITDGSKDGDHYTFYALYVTNAGNNIYGFASQQVGNTNSFPALYDPSIFTPQEGALHPEWAVDEAHKPRLLPSTWQGTYSSPIQGDGSQSYYKISATGIKRGSRGGSYPFENSGEDPFLRWQIVSSALEIYTDSTAFSITAGGAMKTAHYGAGQSPGGNMTFLNPADYQK